LLSNWQRGFFISAEKEKTMEKESLVDIHPLIRNRIRGCLLGVAIGDALGAPFEWLRPGMEGHDPRLAGGRIAEFHPYDGCPAGTWTDDTGMTLASCRALIEHERTRKEIGECFRKAFRDWANSADCRRPGHTVYHASKYGVADENSWGSGALMRTAPVAIYAFLKGLDKTAAAELAVFVARVTHGHPLATFPAIEYVLALMSIFAGEKNIQSDLALPWRYLGNLEAAGDERVRDYNRLRLLPFTHSHPTTGLFMWKQVFEKCLGLRPGPPWSLLSDFKNGILKAVNESVDRDTAGAVAGGILGAYWGVKSIPERWRKEVRLSEQILTLADELMGGRTHGRSRRMNMSFEIEQI
jgi:ADP-ribosylglycohydrolase